MKLLMENWRAYYNEDFDLLCERYDKGHLSEERLVLLWEDSVNREYQTLLNEGIMDILAVGYEKGKELVGKAKAAYDAAVEKVSEFFLKLCMQAWNIAQRAKASLSKIASVLKGVYEKVNAFCDKHPILCKTIKIVLLLIAMLALLVFMSSEAQAAIDVTGVAGFEEGGPLSDAGVDALKGLMQIVSEDKDPETQQLYVKAFQWLEQAQASPEVEQLATAQGDAAGVVQACLETLVAVTEEGHTTVSQLARLGEKVGVSTTNYTSESFINGVYKVERFTTQSLETMPR